MANASDNDVDVISLKLGRVTGKISLGSNLPFGLAINLVTTTCSSHSEPIRSTSSS